MVKARSVGGSWSGGLAMRSAGQALSEIKLGNKVHHYPQGRDLVIIKHLLFKQNYGGSHDQGQYPLLYLYV